MSTTLVTVEPGAYTDLGPGPLFIQPQNRDFYYLVADAQPAPATKGAKAIRNDDPFLLSVSSHVWARGIFESAELAVTTATASGGAGGGGSSASTTARTVTPGTDVPAGSKVIIDCTTAGRVQLKMADGSTSMTIGCPVGPLKLDGVSVVDYAIPNGSAFAGTVYVLN